MQKRSIIASVAALPIEGDIPDDAHTVGTEASAAAPREDVRTARTALHGAPRSPALLNRLGMALLTFAGSRTDTEALFALEEAQRRFQRAAEEASRQDAPTATRRRFDINRALALWMLGERAEDTATIEHALEILEPILRELDAEDRTIPKLAVDWARALDIQANALIALGKIDEAIESHQAALGRATGPRAAARILRNLALTLVEAGRYAEARRQLDKALNHLNKGQAPFLWARLQHSLGDVLSGWAQNTPDVPPEARQQLVQAVAAYRVAQSAYGDAGARTEALSVTVSLTNALAALGAQLCLSPSPTDRETGVASLAEAISLLEPSLPEFTAKERAWSRQIIDLAKESLNYVHTRPSNRNDDRSNVSNKISDLYGRIGSISDLSDNVAAVNNNNAIVSSILRLLSDLPEVEQLDVLRTAGKQVSSSRHKANDEITTPQSPRRRRLSATSPERRERPALPPGLSWPTETYSGSPEAKRGGGGIVAYLERVWRPLLQKGVVTRPVLRSIDQSAAMAVANFERGNRELPKHLHMPSKSELVSAAVGDAEQVRVARRLIRAHERRRISHSL